MLWQLVKAALGTTKLMIFVRLALMRFQFIFHYKTFAIHLIIKHQITILTEANVWDSLNCEEQVYETVETMMVNPDEILKAMKQAEESNMTTSVLKRRFKKLSLNLVGKDEQTKKSSPRNANSDERLSSSTQPFSSFFDSKSSLFAKKPPKPESTSATPVENGWTLV